MLKLWSEAGQVAPVGWPRGRGAAIRGVRRFARSALLLATLASLASTAVAANISGTVFEDVNYGGGGGRSLAASAGVGRGGARVELYDAAGNFVGFTTTLADGSYPFNGLPNNANVTVRVVNSTVTSSRTGYVAGLLPVQTYRSPGTGVDVTDYVGGQNPAVADAGNGFVGAVMNTATGLFTAGAGLVGQTAQSITSVTPPPGNTNGVDFGFNFDTIVNVNAANQGSLEQFILNSNALGGEAALAQSGFRMNLVGALEPLPAGRETSIFMISDGAAHPGLRAGLANLLTGGVAVITLGAADLPAVAGAAGQNTSVDGTTQTANVGNTNNVTLGTGGFVGVDALPLGQVAGPEVEIRGSSGTNNCGLAIQAANAVVRGLAIHGFGDAIGEAGVCVTGTSDALIEGNALGFRATSFADPGSTAERNQSGVYGATSTTSTVQGNLIGFGRTNGIYLAAGAAGWTVTGNEIRDSGWSDNTDGDGFTINGGTATTATGNLIAGSSSQGVVVTASGSANNFINNTVTGNGVGTPTGLVQSPGIVLRSTAASTLLERNVIRANYGAGVQVNNGSTATLITRNSFADNGTIPARYPSAPATTGQIGIDLNSPTDDINFGGNPAGVPPFYTLNDLNDADAGGNGLLNFPVLVSATLSGGNLVLRGYARPDSVIELFIASPDPTGFGEGTTYGTTLTEGGAADTDARTNVAYAGLINGIDQGTDTTNRFTFTVPLATLPAAVGVGTPLTSTATLLGQTSEFSGIVTMANATAVTLMSFEAFPLESAVRLEWSTGSELDNLGFHVYRGLSAKGPWTRLTSSLIPGLGSSPLGQGYSWVDSGLENGVRTFYQLEDVDTWSRSTFHGPVSAVPGPQEPPPGDGSGDGSGSGESTGTTCPAWVMAASGVSPSDSATCTRHGDPEAVSFEEISRSAGQVTFELRTGGFWALHEASGTVRVFVPGFDTAEEPSAAALPVRRALVEAVVGKKVLLVWSEGFDRRSFGGLRPSAVGSREIEVSSDGTVRPARRKAEAARLSGGRTPAELARLVGTVFQGERKSAVVEVTPLRVDGVRGPLVLAGRVRVRLVFAGVEAGEKGSGSRGRLERRGRRVAQQVLARLYTTGRGLHGVRFREVFPELGRGLPTSFLRLQREGEAVPFHVEPTPSRFGPGSVLYLHAERTARSTDFAGEVAYELVVSREGQAMEVVAGAPEGVPLVGTSVGSVTYEANRLYQSGLLEASDLWQWEAMTSGASRTKGFTLEGVDATSTGTGRVVVELQGGSESGGVVDHHVQVYVNGTYGGETRFAGKVPHRMEVEVGVSALREGSNEVQVVNAGDTGVSSLVFLDRFGVEYPQRLEARSGVFEATFVEGGTAEVGGFAGPAVVLDVTAAARWLTGLGTDGGVVRFRAESGHRYVAASAEGLLSPRVVHPARTTLRSAANQADYVLIGPESFLGAAEPLLMKRASEGLGVKAVSLEEIAAVFGHGTASGEAIRSFVSYAYHSWAKPSPRYVVLLGDATYDPQQFVSTSLASPLPALWGKTSYLWTALDPVMGAVNGEDDVPDVAVGRIPATTVEQAEALIGKLLAWEESGQGLSGKATLVADNPDEAGDFEWDVEDIRAGLGDRESEILKVRQLGAGTRPAIQQALDGGLSLLSYVGHGGSAVWASENVWNSWDAPTLLAQSQQPLLLTLTCLNGYFVATTFDSVSESLLKAEGRGAIAAFSPSGMSVDGPAHQYHRAVVQEVVSGRHERLGDAVLAAQELYAETGLAPELLSIYHLFGDPAMKIR